MVLSVICFEAPVRSEGENLTLGWINGSGETLNDCGFFTGAPVAAREGDVMYFGPAVKYQGWHLVVFDENSRPLCQGSIFDGVEITEDIDSECAVMRYTVPTGGKTVRFVADARYRSRYRVAKNIPISAESFAKKDFSVSISDKTTCFDIALTVAGEGVINASGEKIPFSPGTIICMPPQTSYTKTALSEITELHVLSNSLNAQGIADKIIALSDEYSAAEALFSLMYRLYWDPLKRYRHTVEELFGALLSFVVSKSKAKNTDDSLVESIIRIMNDRFCDPDFAALQAISYEHYNPDYVRRRFKKAMGCSPTEYLTAIRVRNAEKLLRENPRSILSVAQAASLSGFYDSTYFSRVFKRQIGSPPSLYRSQGSTDPQKKQKQE